MKILIEHFSGLGFHALSSTYLLSKILICLSNYILTHKNEGKANS